MQNQIFEPLQKVKIICEMALLCKKMGNDTVCTMEEQSVRPWQPLMGISIKSIYVPVRELLYTTTTNYINKLYKFKGDI
jgi:hypothetical protein